MSDGLNTPTRPLRLGFFMSMALGHGTQYLNWRQVIDGLPAEVTPHWVPIENSVADPLARRLPWVSERTRQRFSEWNTLRRGLRQGPFDAAVINPHSLAVKHWRALAAQPTFLGLDATRLQLESFSKWYATHATEASFLGSFRHRRQRRALQAAAGIFALSRWVEQSLVDDYGVDPARVHVIPPGVNPDLWTPPAEPPRNETLRLLFIGGHFERKGGDLLQRWARETTRKGWEMHIVTRDQHPAQPNVIYHLASNNSAQLVALTQSCDLFVLPTRADCSSLAVLEAMASGLPVVTTRVGGLTEMVIEGETGRVIPPDDYDALHSTLDALIDARDTLPAMGRNARARVVENYDQRKLVRRALGYIRARVQ